MSDTSESSGGAWKFLGRARDVLELLQVLFVIAIAALIYFRPTDSEAEKKCATNIVVGLLLSQVSAVVPPEISANIKAFMKRCETDPDVRYVVDAVSEASKVPRVALAFEPTPHETLGPTGPLAKSLSIGPEVSVKLSTEFETGTSPTPQPTTGPAVPPVERTATTGWVAVGFVGDETLFDLPPARTLQTLVAGDELTAKRPVNLRRAAADWTKPLAAVPAGRKVKVMEAPKTLPAGSLTQVWAHVELH